MTDIEDQDLIVLEDRGDYALMRLNRPDKRNAANRAMRVAMMTAMDNVRGKHKVVVLTGTGNSFCAGHDVKEYQEDRKAGRAEDAGSGWDRVNLAIREHPAVFIAAVNGFALGGGSTLINVCDLAIAAQEAQIGMPEMERAIYPGLAGPSAQLTLPRKRAAYLILTAQWIDGATAEAWGIVNQCVPLAQLMDAADKLARRVAQFEAAALAESKRAIDQIPNDISDWRAAFEHGAKVNAAIQSKMSGPRPAWAGSGKRNPGKDSE